MRVRVFDAEYEELAVSYGQTDREFGTLWQNLDEHRVMNGEGMMAILNMAVVNRCALLHSE